MKALKKYPEPVFLSRLSLHWNWLYNKLLKPILASSTWRLPAVMQSAINQLQNIMGQENTAAKVFINYLTSYGHPKPFTTQLEAEVQADIRYCMDSLNVYKCKQVSALKLKVNALVTDGEHLHKQLISICEAFMTNEDGIYDIVTDRIQGLRCALIANGILEEEFEAMDTDDPETHTRVKGHSVKQFVDLWPLFEHFSLICEYSVLTTRKDKGRCFSLLQDYMMKYTPCSPIHLLHIDQQKKQTYLKLGEVIMDRLWSSSVCNSINSWLHWNHPTDISEEYVKDRHRGPGIFHLIPMSYPLFTTLSAKNINPKESSYLPLHVSLGGVEDQLKKLNLISSHLWSCSSAIASPRFDIRNIERQHLIMSFVKMLQAFGSLVPGHAEDHWFSIMDLMLSKDELSYDNVRRIQALYQQICSTVPHPVTPVISRCFEVVIDILQSSELNTIHIGLGLAYIGLASVYLLAPVGPVDPVEKQAIKMNNFQHRLKEIEVEIEVIEMYLKLKTGQNVRDIKFSDLHIRLQYLISRKQELIDKIKKLKEQQAYRPDPIQFQSLIHDVKAFLESIGSVDKVTSLLCKLQTTNQIFDDRRGDQVIITSSLQEEEAWQLAQRSFLDGLDKNYWCYPDLIKPFIVSVQQMRLGMSILAQTVETEQKQAKLSKQIFGQTLENVVFLLSQFPNTSRSHDTFHDLTKCLIYDTTCDLVNTSIDNENNNNHIHSKLLMCGLYLIKIHCIQRGELTTNITQTLSNLFGTFVTAWQDQENRRKQKEAEEASLYKFRSKCHGDERTEEEKEEEEFRSSFPSFEREYADLIGPQCLEEVGAIIEEDYVRSKPDGITVEEMFKIYKIHDLLFTSLVSTDWLSCTQPDKPSSQDYLQPAMLGYSIIAQVAKKSLGALGRDVDLGVIGSHLVISGVVQETILSNLNSGNELESQSELCLKPSDFYDVYYDSNVSEVSQCKGVLDRFIIRLDELLLQFPEHPTILQMLAIIERILTFSITSPIMKFLVGLELLLEKTKDWEANATEQISVIQNFTEVSVMVVKWRKLELGCWKNTMLIEERKCEISVSKWWFHLYQLLTSYLIDGKTEKTVDDTEILTSLKQFLEKSSLGEFKWRLQMILAFHCQVYKMDPSEKQVEVMNLLWNLYQFYHQYIPNIEAEITSQKSPLLKQLKGFVKIARWSDLNYWALKQSTEKTHRTVHKYAKKYQVILNQPVTKLLGEKGNNLSVLTSDNQSHGSTLCERLEVYRQFTLTKITDTTMKVTDVDIPVDIISTLQSRLPVLIPKFNKHWKSVVKSLNYTQLLINLNDFTGDIIETVHELQEAEILQGDDKDKKKSDAKFLNLRKRKALAELFKYLTKMGISYRKGLIMDDDTQQQDSLSLQPLDVTAAMIKQKCGEVLSSQWKNCQEYFYRCITRKAQLEQAILQPAQDLGLGNIERCRGFAHHLHHLFTQQRRELGETFTSFLTIRKIVAEIDMISKKNEVTLPGQSLCKYWLERMKCLCVQLLESLTQYLLLLEACPKHQNDGNDYISPLSSDELSAMANIKKGDMLWQQCYDTVKELISRTETEHQKLLRLSDRCFLLWDDLQEIEHVSNAVKAFNDKLCELSKLFIDPVSHTSCALNEALNILIENITSCTGDFQKAVDDSRELNIVKEMQSSEIVTNIVSSVDNLIENILLVLQKLLSQHSVNEINENGEESDLTNDHIVNGLIGELKTDITEIKTKQISTMIVNITEMIEMFFDKNETVFEGKLCLTLLFKCSPLLERYCEITEFFMAHVISSHRSCGKLLSVLLALFTELAMKGFCVPPELSDEMEKEGAIDFKDIEQGGLGDGEGVKDVSDQIETEDQLDDAHRAGEEKKDEGDQDPNIAPEDNAIEMTDDFEGKPQDLEQEGDDKDDANDEDEEDDDIDKQMGDIDEKDTDKLDEQLWGSDQEDEPDENENPKDETGPGDGEKKESQLVAKDDNQDKTNDDKEEEKQQYDDDKDEQINELDNIDGEGYNDDEIDNNQGDSKEPDPLPETMELPEDLKLDDDEAGDKEEETEMEDQGDDGKEEDGDITEDVPDDKPDDNDDKGDKKDELQDENDGVNEEEDSKTCDDNKNEDYDEDRNDEEGNTDPGFTAEGDEDRDEAGEDKKDSEEQSEVIEVQGKTSHDVSNAEQCDTAQDDANEADNEQQEKVGSGMADTQQNEGHEGKNSSEVTHGSNEKRPETKRQPGKSKEDRSLGVPDQSYQRLKTTEETIPEGEEEDNKEKTEGDIYEHIKDSESHHDAQTLDVATDKQQEEQSVPNKDEDDKVEEPKDDVKPIDDEKQEEEMEIDKKEANQVKGKKINDRFEDIKTDSNADGDREKVEIPGERILTMTVGRGPDSTIHTALEHLYLDNTPNEIDLEKIRADLEENVNLWSHQSLTTPEQMAEASSAWQKYETLTSGLSQELCEQLRLVLEPSQATKLRGDYRTGKRLNMRKVIPYIASQFRKDKIWLKRTKPSKRQYQIMLAIDDSSSMLDNHSKQLAFESLALISNALTLLESGDLAVSSFGESVKLLHSFRDQFSNQSGANILHQFTFEQKKTKIAQLLEQVTSIMIDGRNRQRGIVGNPETSQLLLIVSDGRGLFSEGMEVVKQAVRKAREANIFLVFVIIDNPENKDSILDIRVPIFKGSGKFPEIKSYMEQFPFPFYIILRDINSLPIILSDALRQWFELVTAGDR